METSRKNQLRSILVLVVAALLLELITTVQYYSTRKGITEQLMEMAQRDLSATNRTAQLKQKVEEALAQILPATERFAAKKDKDSLRLIVREMLAKEEHVSGVSYCDLVGEDGRHEGMYIFKNGKDGDITEQVIDFDYTQRSWYSEGINSDAFWSEPYMGKYNEILMCTFSRAVRNAQGESMAVLAADVPLHEVSALASKLIDNQKRTLLPVILLQILGLVVLAFIVQRYVHGIHRLHQVNTEKERITGELNVARGIQEAMQPNMSQTFSGHEDIDIHASQTPAWEVGGDFCDFSIRDEKLFFCIGDVSGKGVPAALVMAVARSTFRMLIVRESAPERIITAMNDTMAQDNEYNMFITMFVGVLDLPTGRLRYSNAGHKAPYVDGKPLPVDSNLPVGAFSNYRFSSQEVEIPSGATIFLYTDGLTEAEDAQHNQYGTARMEEHLKADTARQLIEGMTASVKAFVGDTEQNDDLTMLAIRYSHRSSDALLRRSLTLPCDVNEITRLVEMVEEVCGEVGLPPSATMQVNLALEEAVVNVMNYAYPLGKDGDVTIEAEANTERIKFVVSDSGQPFDPTIKEEVDIAQPLEERAIGGLGIHLIRRYMDSINYERRDNRNILTLRKKIHHT
ncbi:MAG: SpoIIE family protein phosphatase [Prevotella sp.]|nr:SpoIIE family protein phosphatase [Prevotella sp.]